MDNAQDGLTAFIDESSAVRGSAHQEYLVGAVVLPVAELEGIRNALRPLLLKGQIKLHWTDESETRRRQIIDTIAHLDPMSFIVSQVSESSRKTEQFRRKCLAHLYYELSGAGVRHLTLESRNGHQDKMDRAHIVALQNPGLDLRIRIAHARGGDEPLLWIPDAVLGALNSARLGDPTHWNRARETLILFEQTTESLPLPS